MCWSGPGLNSRHSLEGLAFSPRHNLLAAALAARDELKTKEIIHGSSTYGTLTLMRYFVRADDPMAYVTAKVVLVGDSGVGKTGLGWRLANEDFRNIHRPTVSSSGPASNRHSAPGRGTV